MLSTIIKSDINRKPLDSILYEYEWKRIPSSFNPIFDLDATYPESYPGSGQLWNSMISAPADGESETAYEFALGVSESVGSDEPVFTGNAGKASTYWLFDGNDRFNLTSVNPTFIKNIHKTDQTDLELTIALTYYSPANFTSGTVFFIGDNNSVADSGWYLAYDRDALQMEFRHYSSGTVEDTNMGTGTINLDDKWNFILFTMQKTDGLNGNWKLRINQDATVSGTLTTWTSNTTDPGDTLQISGVAGTALLRNGSRLASVYLGNKFLTEEEINILHSLYTNRHDRNYT